MALIRSLPLLAAALLLVGGCHAFTYINIPAEEGDIAGHGSNSPTVRELESVALSAVLAERPVDGVVQIILPEGSRPSTYDIVLLAVGERAVGPEHDASVTPADTLTVKAVRARGSGAEVDIMRHSTAGLSTVYLSFAPFSRWSADRIHHWGAIRDTSAKPDVSSPQ